LTVAEMILLDTNVVSEFMKTNPDTRVMNWLNARAKIDFHLCTPVVAEIGYGIAQLPDGRRKDNMLVACERLEAETFAGRILPFDHRAAHCYAELRATRRKTGKPMSVMDAMIAAIALAHAMTLATRNVRDFESLGVPLVDPFSQ
jgi:predicted nucleic acid-binding protein